MKDLINTTVDMEIEKELNKEIYKDCGGNGVDPVYITDGIIILPDGTWQNEN